MESVQRLAENEDNDNTGYDNDFQMGAETTEIPENESEVEVQTNTVLMKLKYKEAQAVCEEECKKLVKNEVTQQQMLLSLKQNITEVLQQKNNEDRKIESLGIEQEKINTQLAQCDVEVSQMQQELQNYSHVVNELQIYETTLQNRIKNLQTVDVNQKIVALKNKEAIFNDKVKRIRHLKDTINNLKANHDNDDSLKRSRLVTQLQEKSEYLNMLNNRCNEMEVLENINCSLKKEKEEIVAEINLKENEYDTLKNSFSCANAEQERETDQIKSNLEASLLRLETLKNELKETKENAKISNEKTQVILETISVKEKEYVDIKMQKEKVEEEIVQMENKYSELTQKYEKEISAIDNVNENLEKSITDLRQSIEDIRKDTEIKIKNYYSKVDEKNKLTDKLYSLKNESFKQKLLSTEIQLLDKQKASLECEINTMQYALSNISADTSMVDLSKKQALAEASRDFLVEKQENIEKQLKKAKDKEIRLEEEIIDINQKVDELYDQVYNDKSRSGILKVPNTPKTSAGTPKKVQFNASADKFDDSDDVMDALFDRFLEERSKKLNQRSTTEQVKKRKILFD